MSQPEAPPSPRPPAKPAPSSGVRFTRILLGVTLVGMFAFLGSVGLTTWLVLRGSSPDVSEGSYLRLDLSGSIPDAPRPPALFEDPSARPPVATEIASALEKAATDERIQGVYLELDAPQMGWAVAQELRGALTTLREAGKPCVAYSSLYDTKSYYLASVCDEILIPPFGYSFVSGLSVNVTYYAGAFEKLGVEAEMEHVGAYKTFVEPYERTEPSEGAVVAYGGLVDALYEDFVVEVSASRGLEPEVLRGYIDDMHMSPEVNLERGLYTALAFPDNARRTLASVGEEGWREALQGTYEAQDDSSQEDTFTSLGEYVKELRKEASRGKAKIAVIHADGPIVDGDQEDGLFGPSGNLGDVAFRRWMHSARTDDAVKAVVLRVNSPGGSALASDMMWHEVALTKASGKPVVVSMGDYAASGGYFLSTGADWIVAQPGTLTGSIGIGGGKLNLAGTYAKLGLSEHHFKRGERADMFSSVTPFSDGARAMFRENMQDGYEAFVSKVAEGRGLTYEEADAVAQGRVWTGRQALEHRLVDELGGLDAAVRKAAELAEIEDYGLERHPKYKSFLDQLLEEMGGAQARVEVDLLGATPELEEALAEVLSLERMFRSGTVMLLPGNPRVE